MLQIFITHYEDGTHTIAAIKKDNEVLATFENGTIDLTVIKPYIDEEAEVFHEYGIHKESNCSFKVTIREWGINENGIQYISYEPRSN